MTLKSGQPRWPSLKNDRKCRFYCFSLSSRVALGKKRGRQSTEATRSCKKIKVQSTQHKQTQTKELYADPDEQITIEPVTLHPKIQFEPPAKRGGTNAGPVTIGKDILLSTERET